LGLIIGIPVAVIVLIVVIALIASSSGSKTPAVVTTTTPTVTTLLPGTTTPPPSTTPSTAVTPPGITPLAQLLPSDVDSFADCSHNSSPPTGLVGLTNALICTPKNLTGGQIFAFQFDTPADYATSLAALNKFKGFDPSTAGSTCPPGADSQDSIGWHNNAYPSRTGQILECLSVGTNNTQPDYIWTYPTENAVIDAQAADHSTFSDLDSWWTKDAPPP
jgi:hypothetical protein